MAVVTSGDGAAMAFNRLIAALWQLWLTLCAELKIVAPPGWRHGRDEGLPSADNGYEADKYTLLGNLLRGFKMNKLQMQCVVVL